MNHQDTKAPRKEVAMLGVGVVTDAVKHAGEVLRGVGEVGVIEEEKIAREDGLAQLVIRVVHQAWGMGKLAGGEDVGLIVVSGWGTMEATVGFLESMLEGEGKYASPRYFSRSVYSSAASTAAIHFGIKGPCLTLAFEGDFVRGALAQAWRMMAAGRCKRVIVVWAEQHAEIAAELAKLAVERLMRKEYERYVERGLGFGAIAAAVGLDEKGFGAVDVDKVSGILPADEKAFASDAALGWIKKWFQEGLGVE